MGVVITEESELGRELKKWDTPKRLGGMKCDGFEPFPAMLYKAHKRANGKVMCGDPGVVVGDAEATTFTNSCQLLVHDEDHKRRALNDGWRETPNEAIEYFERLEQEQGNAAAEAAFAVQRMGPRAQAELKAADESTHEHVTDVVGASAKTRGKTTRARAVTK